MQYSVWVLEHGERERERASESLPEVLQVRVLGGFVVVYLFSVEKGQVSLCE